ncbi:hypothetical protein BT67DRAFT_445488 [Trichocladium antarcticum]|uniref:Uncharacterized protein n=1 Tax=Trichocladium antarcticum TaxID=1450529 RepID=A0AAN6UCW0_9PEZI|nr:hypothetical protein BT67DRAFT_445488 [Trichocladium antarcticum]
MIEEEKTEETKTGMGRPRESASGWEMGCEEAAVINHICQNLEYWIRRDDGLRKWMEEWQDGCTAEWVDGHAEADIAAGTNTDNSDRTWESGAAGHVGNGPDCTTVGNGQTDGNADKADRMEDGATTAAVVSTKQRSGINKPAVKKTKTSGFGVPEEKRSELVAWLGITGSTL